MYLLSLDETYMARDARDITLTVLRTVDLAREPIVDAVAQMRHMVLVHGVPVPLITPWWQEAGSRIVTDVTGWLYSQPERCDPTHFTGAAMACFRLSRDIDPLLVLPLLFTSLTEGGILIALGAGLSQSEVESVTARRLPVDLEGWATLAGLRGVLVPAPDATGDVAPKYL